MSKKHRPWPKPGRLALLLILVSLSGAVLLAKLPIVAVTSLSNGDFRFMRYSFSEEDPAHPRLQLLRRREKLDAVVAGGRTQFDKIVLLRKWARQQWTSRGDFYYPPWDAVEILDLARRHRNYGFCAQYAIVFAQACLSMGLHARYVELGHFLTEVWSDEHDRWVVMDPANDLHYEKDGFPLRGRELDDAAWRGEARGVMAVRSDGSRVPLAGEELKKWRGYSIVMRNDHLSHPVLVEEGGRLMPLTHRDDHRSYRLTNRDQIGWAGEVLAWRAHDQDARSMPRDRAVSGDPDDFRNAYNQTIIFVVSRHPGQGAVKLKLLAEHAPGLTGFQISTTALSFEQSPFGEVYLLLRPGLNELSARVKTRFGWLGPASTIKVFYKPAWF